MLRVRTSSLSFALLLAALLSVPGMPRAGDGGHKYVKSSKCKMCHRKVQFESWQDSLHAKALANLEALSDAEIAELGKTVGIENATKDDCIECHVTAYDPETKTYVEPGVACEACHGPGKDYAKLSVMKNRGKAVAAGLVIPTEELCVGCHNERSPKYKPFDFREMRNKVHTFKNPPTD